MKFYIPLIPLIVFIFFNIEYGFTQATCATAVPITLGTQQCGSSQGQLGDFPAGVTAPTNPCNSLYNDDEYWFTITGDGVNSLQLDLTGISQTYAGIFVFDDCPANNPTCIAGNTNGNNTSDISLTTFNPLANGTVYYVAIVSWGAPDWTAFCLDAAVVPPLPPITNDSCINAIPVMVNSGNACTLITSGSTTGATASLSGCTGTANDDVWFSFVATDVLHNFTISNVSPTIGTSTDMVHEVFSGACGTLASLSCSDPNFSTVSGLTVGTTYYIRVYSYFTSSSQTFDLCIGTPPPPPINDLCLDAIKLLVNPNDSCAIFGSGTTASASQSIAGCTGTANDDVWFSFDATSTNHLFIVNNVVAVTGSSVDMVHEVFSGACGALASLSCSDPDQSVVSGFTVGQTYYVRVYSYFTSSSQTFDLCIGTPPPPPVNDLCVNAQKILVNLDTTCTLFGSGTTNFATQSMPGCIGTANDDIWFSFDATNTSQMFTLKNIVSSTGSTDMVHEVFSGTCGALVSMHCQDPEFSILSGFTVGTTYYVRVYGYFSSSSFTFDLCIATPPLPPVNDLCQSALPLPVQLDSCATWTIGTNVSATDSGVLPAPTCGSYGGADTWYEVVVGASGAVNFDVQNVTWTSAAASLYSGTSCTSLTEVDCTQFASGWPFIFTGLTPGTYYLRVWDYSNDDIGTFELCAVEYTACSIASLTSGTQTACDSLNGNYTQNITISHNAPSGSTIDLNGQIFTLGTSPETLTLTGLLADGLPVTVIVTISGTSTCALTEIDLFTAPSSCFSLPTTNCGSFSSSPGAVIDDANDPSDTITVSNTGMILSDLNVVVKVDHTYLADLDITLTSPTGTIVALTMDNCTSEDNMEIEFDDLGNPLVCASPTVGYFVPDGNLSDFNGQLFDGDWVLSVMDDAASDDGTLVQWCLIPDLILNTEAEDVIHNAIQLAPNPTEDQLGITFTTELDQLDIWSIDGRHILNQSLNGVSEFVNLDVKRLLSGAYIIRFTSGNQVITKRFIKL